MDRRPPKQHRSPRLGAIERDILNDLSLGDMLYGFLLSGRSTRQLFKRARERATCRYRRKLAIQHLKELNFIRMQGERLLITADGRNALGVEVEKTHRLLHTNAWDHKWRIVAYDIPEKYAVLRNTVRDILKKAGFIKFQHSIWIFPHDCDGLVQLIQDESLVSKYVLYGVVDRIQGEDRFKKMFGFLN